MHPITAFVIGSLLAVTAIQVGSPNEITLVQGIVSLICGIGLALIEYTDSRR